MVAVLRSPRVLFAALVDRPRWAGVMLATLLITGGCGVALMQTTVGRQALVDQWERTALAFGQDVSDERYARLQEMSRNGAAYAAVSAVAGGPVLTCAIAALIFAVFAVGRRHAESGAGPTYAQVLAVAAHAGVVLALRQVVATPLSYSRETLASPTTLMAFFPMFDEASPMARFFGAIDLFVIWWVIVLAIGVALLYRRPARSTALAFMGAYVAFAALLAVAMAVSGGTV